VQRITWQWFRLAGVGVLGLILLAEVVSARGVAAPPANPLDTILAKLDQIVAVLIPPAGPVKLFSAQMNTASSDRQLRCSVVNVSAQTLEVTFEIRSSFGTVEGPTVRTIDPGEASDIATQDTSSFSRCEVSFTGNKDDVRGHFVNEVLLGGGDTEMVLSLPLN